MDLIWLVLTVCLIGFVIWLLTEKIPMPPYWSTTLQVAALVILVLYVVARIGPTLPDLLP